MDMFTSAKRSEGYMPSEGGQLNATIIARGVKVEGEFTSQGDVIIEGEVHGHVTTAGTLSVGSEARLKADVVAQEATVAGNIDGNLTVKNRLELKSTAKVAGDISCETVVVEAGAMLNGKIAVGSAANVKPEMPTKHEKAPKAVAGSDSEE